ncbi:MAG: hypothetical protein M3463_09880 [Verrucomicrobiota bacterium]|nr:hypothetical protein [Verrucomicrobiota bacterium]
MFARVRQFFSRHPLLRDAVLWALPAIIFGAALRLLLLWYVPYAYWGSDSRSYYSFAHLLLSHGDISLDEKRRYLYPLLMLPVSLLPGETLRWLAWLQHGLGLVTLLPLAYIVRKTLVHWRLWIAPVTMIYAGLPLMIWYEHELLGDTVFFAALLWAFAGWVAWVREARLGRLRQLFWWFFVPFALFLLTKPAGRFAWPGICLGLVIVLAWRTLDRRHWVALGMLALVSLTVGSKKQSAWLLYVAAFPLTQVESPRHATYKAEIRDKVEELRRHIDVYYLQDEWPFTFLENPGRGDGRPLWKELAKDEKRKTKVYLDLALEGIKARPDLFAYLGLQRLIGSANSSEFKESRFGGDRYAQRFEHHYAEAQNNENNPVRMLFALPPRGPLPPYAEFQKRLSPAPDSWMARALQSYVRGFESVSDLFHLPDGGEVTDRQISKARPTPLGWWLAAAMLLSLLPRYRRTFGVWTIVAGGYLCGVFLVSQINPRYFAPAWTVLVPLLAVPADALGALLAHWLRARPPS